ncbi:hypothetical protein C8039_10745 [Halogeometricum sp. wsp3]|nr:hypothetical protein C8039_10745 [Halogeometricum sp. wsp3]
MPHPEHAPPIATVAVPLLSSTSRTRSCRRSARRTDRSPSHASVVPSRRCHRQFYLRTIIS